jgi:putative ribosome biogenesis GTPase RsgA
MLNLSTNIGWILRIQEDDTPGLKALALWDIEPEELDGYFT